MIIRFDRFNPYLRPVSAARPPCPGPVGACLHCGNIGLSLAAVLALVLILGLACGCQSPESKSKKRLSTLRVHLETNLLDATNRTAQATISESPPVQLTVEKMPFLSEADIKEAKVVEMVGGFSIQLEFDRRGAWLLEQYSGANRGRHFAIFSQFTVPPDEQLNKGRWLAAPRILQRITDGVLTFTPLASREEADQIVSGLNHVAKKLKTGSEW
jgi:preprotein translocase subunit SecD